MKKAIAICLIACIVVTGYGGSRGGVGEPQEAVTDSDEQNVKIRDEIIFCQGNGLATLDATIGRQEGIYSISNNILDPLFTYDSDMKVQLCLATEYEWADDTTLKLTLREGVKFHDRSDASTENARFTLDLIDQRRALFARNYDGCTIDDDYHVTVKLKASNPAFLNILTLPQAFVVPAKYDEAAFGADPIGTSPYKLEEAVEGDYYTLKRFDNYWGGLAEAKLLAMKIVPGVSQHAMTLETGEMDVVYGVPSNDTSRIQEGKDLQILTSPSMRIILTELNCSSGGPVGNPDVRKATKCAINGQTIVGSLLCGFGTVSDNIIPQSAQDCRGYETNGYNPEKARSLLAQTGYSDDIQLTLWTNSNQTGTETAQVLQSQLAEMGINLNIVTWDNNTSFSLIEAGENSDLMLDFWQTNTGHADYIFNGMLLSTSVNNFSRCYNPKFDETYVKYVSTGEGEEGEALLKQLYDDMVMDIPVIGLYGETKVTAAASKLQGLMLSQIDAHEYQNTVVTKDQGHILVPGLPVVLQCSTGRAQRSSYDREELLFLPVLHYQGTYREGTQEELVQLSHDFQVETGVAGRRDCP